MKTLKVLGLLLVILMTAPRPCHAAIWMTSYDWFYADQFKVPDDPYEAEELAEQVFGEEKAMREAYVRGVADTLMLLNTTKTDNKDMLDGLKNLSFGEMSELVTRIYKEQPQYRDKPVIFILGYIMPKLRTRLGKPLEEQLKGDEFIETP